MHLQTQIPLQKQPRNLIDYHSNLVLLGSCFSQNIGKKLDYFKFQNLQNPFGILFHPIAIEKLILNAVNQKKFEATDLIFQNERWHSFDAHSSLSASDKQTVLENLKSGTTKTHNSLLKASHIIVTLGTAWVYRYIESDKIVANCHKIPQKKFTKELLSVDEISQSLQATIALIKSLNKDASIIFTVSPVRHLKDGFVENMQSKSHLIAAIHNAIDIRKNIYYFPSYEIMMDELRDYRFYDEDMIHPNKTAINYIWEKFIETWFSAESKQVMKEIDSIQKGILHKPFNKKSLKHQQFLDQLNVKKEKIKNQFSHISF